MEYEVVEDKKSPGDWRVEASNDESNDRDRGECYVAIFTGSLAKERAMEYANWKNETLRAVA
jgi:hypothetical protein